jgi:hypothetical protein
MRRRHRQAMASFASMQAASDLHKTKLSAPRATLQPLSSRKARGAASPIGLDDMDPRLDRVYKGRVLTGVLIEAAFTMTSTVSVLVDDSGRAERIAFYNIDNATRGQLTVGRRLSVYDPYLRVAADGNPAVRIDDPTTLEFHDAVAICNNCAQPVAKLMACARCRAVAYCSKQCQQHDWTMLGHKTLCSSRPS